MANTNLIAVAPELTGSVSFGGLRAYGLGHAVDADLEGVVYLSLVGYRAATRAVWAALLSNQAIELGGQLLYRLEGAYLTRSAQLPESGLEHMIILHHQAALPQLEPGQPFYVLNATDAPPLERFVAMLDRATAVPLEPAWGTWLWKQGLKRKLIEPLADTRGVEAWRVSADSDLWLALIEREIRQQQPSAGGEQLFVMKTVAQIIARRGGLDALTHIRVKNSGYMPLVIERIGTGPRGLPLLSIAHYHTRAGDAMRDPEMTFEIATYAQGQVEWLPVSYRQDNLGIYQETVGADGRVVEPGLAEDLRAFALQWDRNLEAQGFLEAAAK